LPAVVVITVFVLWPAATALRSLPYPALYTNSFGAGRVGYFFPHDEFYDVGARESIEYIAQHAPSGALVASEIPTVLQYYLERYGRTDIRSAVMSDPSFRVGQAPGSPLPVSQLLATHQPISTTNLELPAPAYLLVQPGRVYFENERYIAAIESMFDIVQASNYRGAVATRVYRVRQSVAAATRARAPLK